MDLISYDWPFVALAAGVVGLALLVAWPRLGGGPRRWDDPAWLACLILPVYMIHQFEEHGVDLLGRRYHFIVDLCTLLGQPELAACPADPAFIFAVNVGAVWLAGLTAILWRHRNPRVAACAVGVPLVNAAAHVAPALLRGAYNSGLVTALVLFVPLAAVVLRGMWRAGAIRAGDLRYVVASGVLVHAVLAGALIASQRGLLPRPAMLGIEVANGFVPLAVGSLLRR